MKLIFIILKELFQNKTKKDEIMSKLLDKFRDDIYFEYFIFIFFALYKHKFVSHPKIHYLKIYIYGLKRQRQLTLFSVTLVDEEFFKIFTYVFFKERYHFRYSCNTNVTLRKHTLFLV